MSPQEVVGPGLEPGSLAPKSVLSITMLYNEYKYLLMVKFRKIRKT